MPSAPEDKFKQGAEALGGVLKTSVAGWMRKAADSLTSSSPTPPAASPSRRRSGRSSDTTPGRTDESHASSWSSPSTGSVSSSRRKRTILVSGDGVRINGVLVPCSGSPGYNVIDGEQFTDNDFQIEGEAWIPAGSPMSEIFASFDRWYAKRWRAEMMGEWPTVPGDGEGEGGPMIEPLDGEAAERVAISNPDDPGSFFERRGIPFMDFSDRLEAVEPLPTDRGPYVAGESGKVAVFRFGRRLTDWYDDPAEAMEAYEHDPTYAFDEVDDVAEHIIIPVDDLVDTCYSYLGTIGAVIWADWDISKDDPNSTNSAGKPNGRIVAARWLAEQIQGVAKIVREDDDRG